MQGLLCIVVTPIMAMYCCSSRVKDEAFLKSVGRIITIWEERNVFEMDALTRFKASLGETVHFVLYKAWVLKSVSLGPAVSVMFISMQL